MRLLCYRNNAEGTAEVAIQIVEVGHQVDRFSIDLAQPTTTATSAAASIHGLLGTGSIGVATVTENELATIGFHRIENGVIEVSSVGAQPNSEPINFDLQMLFTPTQR